MSRNNSYNRYRQYRKNQRRYNAEVGFIPVLIVLGIFYKTVSFLKIAFVVSIIALVIFLYFSIIRTRTPKVKKIELDDMNDEMFKIYCSKLFLFNGFQKCRDASKGINLIIEKDKCVYGVRCIIKPKNAMVDADVVRETVIGSKYYYCDKAVIITNRSFSRNAIKLSDDLNVLLWDRKELIKLLEKDSYADVI